MYDHTFGESSLLREGLVMIGRARRLVGAVLVALCGVGLADEWRPAPDAEAVVATYFESLKSGDVGAMDPLFFRIEVMESSRSDWLALLGKVVEMVESRQMAWDVVCSNALTETAVVIVNQTMDEGKPHADPDAIFLVKADGGWLLLPDVVTPNVRREVSEALTAMQRVERHALKRWVLMEIRGLSSDCS